MLTDRLRNKLRITSLLSVVSYPELVQFIRHFGIKFGTSLTMIMSNYNVDYLNVTDAESVSVK